MLKQDDLLQRLFFVGISYLIRFLLAKASGSKKNCRNNWRQTKQSRGRHLMDLATISSIITQTLVYATPLILTALNVLREVCG